MSVQCTEAEWKIMEVLWDRHPRTMSDITKTLEPATGWTRHTVITLLKRMHDKGSVSVDESGSVKLYSPMISREEASTSQTRKLLDRVFNGKASLLINHLVDSGEMTVDEIQSLLAILQKEESKNTGGDET